VKTTRLIKKIDYRVGRPILRLISAFNRKKHPPTRADPLKRALIIRPGGIGDAALLIPSLKILKTLEPEIQIDLLCEPRNMSIFWGSPFVSDLFNYKNLRDLISIKKTRYDIVVDTEQSHLLSAALTSSFQQSLKVGFDTNERGRVYDIKVGYFQNQYERDSFFRLFEGVIRGWPPRPGWEPPYLFPTPGERQKVSSLLGDIKRPIVCIFPGASIKERRWPVERWAGAARYLWENGRRPVLLGGADEWNLTNEIVKQVESPLLNLCNKLTLSETGALFEKTRLLISADSGILHLGALADLPTLSLFGPGIAKKWAPRGDKHIVLNKGMACSPCTRFGETPQCKINARCLRAIRVADVTKAIAELIERPN
jgi:ADP-heptose:LPS heptosyltransferase